MAWPLAVIWCFGTVAMLPLTVVTISFTGPPPGRPGAAAANAAGPGRHRTDLRGGLWTVGRTSVHRDGASPTVPSLRSGPAAATREWHGGRREPAAQA